MAGFSEAYYCHGNLISSVWTGGQYLIDPEMRARRIVNISQSASIEFCKAFWFLAESGKYITLDLRRPCYDVSYISRVR